MSGRRVTVRLLARLVGLQSAQAMASETVADQRACDGRSKGAQRPLVLRSAAATVGDLCRTASGHSSTSRSRLLGVTGCEGSGRWRRVGSGSATGRSKEGSGQGRQGRGADHHGRPGMSCKRASDQDRRLLGSWRSAPWVRGR